MIRRFDKSLSSNNDLIHYAINTLINNNLVIITDRHSGIGLTLLPDEGGGHSVTHPIHHFAIPLLPYLETNFEK